MNVIKLKDIIMPSECRMSKLFNEQLKGKYAYWIKMRYIFPMETMDYKTYIKYEQLDEIYMLGSDILPHIDMYGEECSMYDFAQNYIDHTITENINTTVKYLNSNKYATDYDISADMLRKFRTWLANELLVLNTNNFGDNLSLLTNEQIYMLEYYKNNMYNDVVKQLNIFGGENSSLKFNSNTGCDCCTNSTNLYKLTGTLVCDALSIYRKNIHTLMVKTFEDVDFWMKFNKEFIEVFKKYIDNIIKSEMIINIEANNVLYNICVCNESSINTSNEILQRLSKSLQYIIDDDTNGHKNFIYNALHDWAEYLYEKMSWEIK